MIMREVEIITYVATERYMTIAFIFGVNRMTAWRQCSPYIRKIVESQPGQFICHQFDCHATFTHGTITNDTWQFSQSEDKKLGQGIAVLYMRDGWPLTSSVTGSWYISFDTSFFLPIIRCNFVFSPNFWKSKQDNIKTVI